MLSRVFDWVYATVTGSTWRRTRANGHWFEWSGQGETVRIRWLDGAGEHSGWTCDVERPDVTVQVGVGLVSFTEALVLADLYMAHDRIIPAFPASDMRQDEWLDENVPEFEFEVIDTESLEPTRPLHSTP